MTSASISESSPIDNTWQNQDGEQRLLSIEKLAQDSPGFAEFLLKVAIEDEDEAVRCLAVSRITQLAMLETLQDSDGKVKESAQQQVYRIIAGSLESDHSEQERLDCMKQLPASGIKQVALITKLKNVGSSCIESLDQDEDLADTCLFASSVHVRKAAALKIEDSKLLKEIQRKVLGKDKTVSKVIANRLGTDSETTKPEAKEEKPITAAAKVGDSAKKPQDSPRQQKEKAATKKQAPAPESPAVEPEIEFEASRTEAEKLSFKNTTRLFEVRSQLRKLRNRLTEEQNTLSEKIVALQSELEVKIGKNNEYQNELKVKTEELLASMSEALESGNSESATQIWDKVQGNISNTANQVKAELQKEASQFKEKITELRDWKIFAATEKKKEIITQMEHLIESKMHPSDRSKTISKAHKSWKALGRSNQNEQLWKQFKKLSDQAYEPCKEYFKQRKQLMNDNLMKRREICVTLETEHKALLDSDAAIDISKLNKLLNNTEKDWKQFAPIEQSKIKSLQKRFYGTVNELRKLRKDNVSGNAKLKRDLIKQAQDLTKLDDNKQAMNDAKRLQQEWKSIGPTSYKEDNKYWQEFRAACDTIFNKKNQASKELNVELKEIEQRLQQILSSLEELSSKEESAFRESRGSYQDLAQEFSNSLDPRIKSQRKRLLDRFNTAKRQIDSRFRALPDKRQQQAQKTIREKNGLLLSLENALVAESDDEKIAELQNAFDRAGWDAIAASGNADIDELLAKRLELVLAVKSSSEMRKLCQQSSEDLRMLCIQAEIRANIDSPAEDKPLRMKLQLEQLQNGFSQAKPDPKQNLKYATSIELQSQALGPLEEVTRADFSTRLASIVKKLR